VYLLLVDGPPVQGIAEEPVGFHFFYSPNAATEPLTTVDLPTLTS
jgi:hypothetical protein